jgi:hypothetical protein
VEQVYVPGEIDALGGEREPLGEPHRNQHAIRLANLTETSMPSERDVSLTDWMAGPDVMSGLPFITEPQLSQVVTTGAGASWSCAVTAVPAPPAVSPAERTPSTASVRRGAPANRGLVVRDGRWFARVADNSEGPVLDWPPLDMGRLWNRRLHA